MKQVKLQLEALEPLIISDGSFDGMAHQALDFIPGNMLLGAMASLWVRQNRGQVPDDHPEFRKLFLSEKVRFGNAYPGSYENLQSWPIPLCFRHIKNQHGMPLVVPTEETPSPIVLNTTAFMDEIAEYNPKLEIEEAEKLCKQKGFPSESLRLKKEKAGFFHPETGCRTAPEKQWIMHVAMDSKKRRAKDKKLFGYQSLCSGTHFIGDIQFDKEEDYELFISLTAQVDTLYLGHSRSAGYGRTRVAFEDDTATGKTSSEITANSVLRIMLISDYMAPVRWKNPHEAFFEELEQKTGVTFESLHNESFCAYRSINGYNSHWRLPRTTRTAITRGSILSCKANGAIGATTLNEILFEGVGGCKREGYGKICFDPNFLKSKTVKIQSKSNPTHVEKETSSVPQNIGKSIALLRKRSLTRIAGEHVHFFLASEQVHSFLDSFKKTSLSNSQLGNLRILLGSINDRSKWSVEFEKIDDKTAGRRWKSCRVKNLLPNGPGQDTLFNLTTDLLNPDTFLSFWSSFAYKIVLPGGEPTRDEMNRYNELVHRSALSGLIGVMKIAKRLGQDGGDE